MNLLPQPSQEDKAVCVCMVSGQPEHHLVKKSIKRKQRRQEKRSFLSLSCSTPQSVVSANVCHGYLWTCMLSFLRGIPDNSKHGGKWPKQKWFQPWNLQIFWPIFSLHTTGACVNQGNWINATQVRRSSEYARLQNGTIMLVSIP